MNQNFDPKFEYARGPVLWAWVTWFVLGVPIFFVFHRPSWLLPAAFVAGGVAAARGDFYDQSANNGFLGVLLGLLTLLPVVILYRVVVLPGYGTVEDTVFFAAVIAVADVIVRGPLMLVLGYLGAVVVDFLRRRIGGPIGY